MTTRQRVDPRGVRLALVLTLSAVAGSCGGGGGDITEPPINPPDPPAVASVEVAPNAVNLIAGGTAQLVATPKSAGDSAMADRAVTWTTSDVGIASVNATGLVTAVAVGEATVTATSEGKAGSAAVSVSTVPVATVEVAPNPAGVSLGQTAQLLAVTKDGGGAEIPGRAVAWSTSDEAVATVSTSGLVTGIAAGNVTITATSEGKTGTTLLTVSAVTVASVAVTPPTASIAEGETTVLVATAKDANGATLPGRPAVWTSSDTKVAKVSATGAVTGQKAGTATITATIEGKTASSVVTVASAAVASVEVQPASPTVVVGATLQLTAVTKAASGAVLSGRSVTWTTSDAAVATVSATGQVKGVAAGTVTITATSETISGTAAVIVSAVTGTTRTWKGGVSGKQSDWSAAGNWNPAGKPIALDTANVPAVANPAVLSEDVTVARLRVPGGHVRTAGHRLTIQALVQPAD